ncbi:MAG: universal stress protein, partial [Flavobacteriaceae bacterium]
MKNILIPTDFSQNAWNALEYAAKLFKDVPCTFHILHIGDLKDSDIKGNFLVMPLKQVEVKIKQELDHLFERIKQLPENRNHHFIALQEYGNILNTVRKKVEDNNIDLIVMGTKGASGVKKTIVGSNTGDVITKIQCNVLVVPEKAHFVLPKHIAFPTDYNIFYSYAILECISD